MKQVSQCAIDMLHYFAEYDGTFRDAVRISECLGLPVELIKPILDSHRVTQSGRDALKTLAARPNQGSA